MTPRNASAAAPATGGVHDLIHTREQLRAWIGRLDEVKEGAPSRVAERVRADYEERLRRVNDDLASHGEEISRDLERLQGELSAAEERRAQAADALEETRLRHLIGELDEGAWDETRPTLEGALGAADQEVEAARGEVERLSTLAAEIMGGPGTAAEAAPEPVAEAAPEPEAAIEPEPAAAADEAPAPAAEAPEEAAAPQAGGDEDAVPSGEELAAWLSEVSAEGADEPAAAAPAPPSEDDTAEERPLAGADADNWDPFQGEFGPGAPTQPGDAAGDLPWLNAADADRKGAAWSPSAGSDGLEFLKELESVEAGADAAAGDLQEDDLAFLEELDRAISGSTARQPAVPAPPPPPADEPQPGFLGADAIPQAAQGSGARPAGGGRLLCKECGALNEPQSWYCEICGSEL